MPPKRVREEGFSKDADKLVRRLSLVALLLSRRGQPVSVAEIRSKVEGYPTMTEEAFKRRFYEDRYELKELGIEIRSDEDPLSETSSELYSLPADAYYLEPIKLDGDEVTALAACLAVLEDRFAYSQPLRLALLSLAQGRPELIAEAEAPPLTVVPEAHEPAAALPKLQAAVAERKTVEFAYYAISRDEEMERIVDPYGLQLVAGEWYLIGWCHRARPCAPSASRASARASSTTRAGRTTSRRRRTSTSAPTATGRRGSWPSPAARRGCASRRPWRGGSRRTGPTAARWSSWTTAAIVYETPYADARPLLGWVLGLADEAELLEPADLRAQLRGQLDRLAALLDAPPPGAAVPASLRPRRPLRPGDAGPTPT